MTLIDFIKSMKSDDVLTIHLGFYSFNDCLEKKIKKVIFEENECNVYFF